MNGRPTFPNVDSVVRIKRQDEGMRMPVTQAEVESIMNHFAESRRGGRCEECGFDWKTSFDDASSIMRATPERYRGVIDGHFEQARSSATGSPWSPSEYVWHVADAVGIWGERLKALADDPEAPFVGFDHEDLAEVRGYSKLSAVAGLWALERRVADWNEALSAHDPSAELKHPDFGPWTIEGIVRWMAHECHHHGMDIVRGLGKQSGQEEVGMRAMDCSDPGTHEDIHFTAENDEELFQKIQQHRDEYHQEMGDDQIRQLISANAYDE